MTCRIAGAVLLLLALLGGTALAGPFEDGVKAYNKGDYGAAAREFGKAARQGHLDAQANLGVLFELGRGVKRDHSEAAFWYRMAAENGHLAARFNLALKYRKGQGVPKDLGKAAKWLAEAAAGGDEQSKRLLGAVRAEIKALAAKPKQPAPTPAQAAKGGGKLSSATGKPAKNPFELCRDLIKQGLLGLAEPYCLKDLKAGEAKFGRNHPNVAKSRANYASLRRKKRQANKKARRGRALFLEAYNYSQGKTVKRDKAKALELYLKAAKLGNATAQYSLGLHYRGGRADNGGESKAARLLYMAARQGHRGAQSHLGGLYLKGKGLAKDPAEGALWLRAAAEQGVRYDQYRLAILYRDGRGVKRDNVEAYKWLDIALGSKISDRSRKKWGAIRAPLAARMTPAEITRAKDLAKQWKWKKKFEIVPIIAAARVLPEPTVLAKMAPIPVEPEIKVAKNYPKHYPKKPPKNRPVKRSQRSRCGRPKRRRIKYR